jgi:hypothetical protein
MMIGDDDDDDDDDDDVDINRAFEIRENMKASVA